MSSPLFVILNGVKNPSGSTAHCGGGDDPTGFFAALRMTGFVDFMGLKAFSETAAGVCERRQRETAVIDRRYST